MKWWQTSNLKENNLCRDGGGMKRIRVARLWGISFFFFFSFIWDRDAGALQSNGDICSSSSEELKRSYLHTKGFTTQKDDPLGAYEYSYTLSVNSVAPLMNVRKTCAARDVTLRQYQAIRAPLFLIWLRAMLLSLEYEFHYNNITKCFYFI